MVAAFVFVVAAGLARVLEPGGTVAVLRLVAALAVAVCASVMTTAMQERGIRLTGVAVARAGGTAAAGLLALAAVATDHDERLASAAAGVGAVSMLGLLAVGVSRPLLRTGQPHAWLAVTGLAVWAAAALSTLSLAADPLAWLVPVAWIAALAWVPAATVILRTGRGDPGPKSARTSTASPHAGR